MLLDFLRRELAVTVHFLDRGHQEGMQQRSYQHLKSSWALATVDDLEQATIVFPCAKPRQLRAPYHWTFLSPRGAFGSFLRRLAFPDHGEKLKGPDIERMLSDLFGLLTTGGMITPKEELNGVKGYQVSASPLRFRTGDGTRTCRIARRIARLRGAVGRIWTPLIRTRRSGWRLKAAVDAGQWERVRVLTELLANAPQGAEVVELATRRGSGPS